MTKQTELEAVAEWLDMQVTKHITEYAMEACCTENPRCAAPCDDCWTEAEDKIKELMRRVADEFRSH